jgi:hypothetical protein
MMVSGAPSMSVALRPGADRNQIFFVHCCDMMNLSEQFKCPHPVFGQSQLGFGHLPMPCNALSIHRIWIKIAGARALSRFCCKGVTLAASLGACQKRAWPLKRNHLDEKSFKSVVLFASMPPDPLFELPCQQRSRGLGPQ